MQKRNLVVFDIDGTVTDTVVIHQNAFRKALHLMGIKKFNDAFHSYKHHTDTHIVKMIFESVPNHLFDAYSLQNFENHLYELISKDEIKEIRGAKRVIDFLESETEFGVCYATGSLHRPAKLKLERIGIEMTSIQLVASNEIEERDKIVAKAIGNAKMHYEVENFDRIISFGDGLWDLRTAQNLSLEFIGVGMSNQKILKDNGMEKYFCDFDQFNIKEL